MVCHFQYFCVFATCFLKLPSSLTLACVDFFLRILGKDNFVLVDLTGGFTIFGPIYNPVLERWGVMIEVVMTNRCYRCFISGFCNGFSQCRYSLEPVSYTHLRAHETDSYLV